MSETQSRRSSSGRMTPRAAIRMGLVTDTPERQRKRGIAIKLLFTGENGAHPLPATMNTRGIVTGSVDGNHAVKNDSQ